VRDETRISLPANPSLTQDDARPIVRRPTDLPGGRLRQSLGANRESLVAQLVLQYSALNRCATREARIVCFKPIPNLKRNNNHSD
jgi:hypothetical protein